MSASSTITAQAPVPGTKAETLELLLRHGFPVPPLKYFTKARWEEQPEAVLTEIAEKFPCTALAVRSSACNEDSCAASMAGAFDSVLHVPSQEPASLRAAINKVTSRYEDKKDQVLIQPMVPDVALSGVVMTRTLEDGSPYYVINYDDISGRTDTITSGSGISKTVCVYRGVKAEYFDSPRLCAVLELVRRLENFFAGLPLDIEFVVDARGESYLLQARPIAAARHWRTHVAEDVSRHIRHVETYARDIMAERPGLPGRRSLLGVMPDWNPAEIIGVTPRPLAMSLYRDIITRRVWRVARQKMGYRTLPPVELMLSLAGRPYIDVRASFNSFIPEGVSRQTAGILVDAWLNRLDAHPELHDKVEFAIVPTVLDFDFDTAFQERYAELLPVDELLNYKAALRRLTNRALQVSGLRPPEGSLEKAMNDAQRLELRQRSLMPPTMPAGTPFSLVTQLTSLLEECKEWGTLPFSIAARHAFMAESLLRSAVRRGALQEERLAAFKRTVRTISGELSHDFAEAVRNPAMQPSFIARYGHLRPGTYDILTPCYAQRDLFADVTASPEPPLEGEFSLTATESNAIAQLLDEAGLDCTPRRLLDYARRAIAGREWIKFIFTRHVCAILETIVAWGQSQGLTREECAMLPLEVITGSLHAPLPDEAQAYYKAVIAEQHRHYDLARSLRLAPLIRSVRDIYVAAQQRSEPNFITDRHIEAPVVTLEGQETTESLQGRIVCIESADPGYDWLFTRNIAGLITRYGGANSHMAIRCAEYGLPAAIGCGGILYERASRSTMLLLDCAGKRITPLRAEDLL